jgi:hypothetical protein
MSFPKLMARLYLQRRRTPRNVALAAILPAVLEVLMMPAESRPHRGEMLRRRPYGQATHIGRTHQLLDTMLNPGIERTMTMREAEHSKPVLPRINRGLDPVEPAIVNIGHNVDGIAGVKVGFDTVGHHRHPFGIDGGDHEGVRMPFSPTNGRQGSGSPFR